MSVNFIMWIGNEFINIFENIGLYFLLTLIALYLLIPYLVKLKFGQMVRANGPETHLQKQGTPTMGGVVFIVVLTISILLYILGIKKHNINISLLIKFILVIIAFSGIGLYDDLIKIKNKNSNGIKAKIKFSLQVILSFIGLLLLTNIKSYNIFYILLLLFIIVGTNNAVNFTDGLDGLLTSVTIVITLFYIVLINYFLNNSVEISYYATLLVINYIFLGMEVGFLLFNKYPAKIFMGDTGSLLIGAYVAFMAILLKIELFLPLYGFIYFIEAVSVILQVGYFKYTKGKRLFKMAPIHHHFEKCNMSEIKIVLMFTGFTILVSIISLIVFGVIKN